MLLLSDVTCIFELAISHVMFIMRRKESMPLCFVLQDDLCTAQYLKGGEDLLDPLTVLYTV